MARLAWFTHLGFGGGSLDAGLGGDRTFSCGTFPDTAAQCSGEKNGNRMVFCGKPWKSLDIMSALPCRLSHKPTQMQGAGTSLCLLVGGASKRLWLFFKSALVTSLPDQSWW